MAITMDAIKKLAPDSKAVSAAKSVANPKHWTMLGRQTGSLWGQCQGSDTYQVYVDTTSMACNCSCPSRKRPCKHALALLMLDAGGHPFPDAAAPSWLVSAALAPRYESSWE